MIQFSPKNYPDNNPKLKNKGFLRGQITKSLITLSSQFASFGMISLMKKSSVISKDEYKQLNKAAQKGLRGSGLYKKGVRIHKVQEISFPKSIQEFKKISPIKFIKKDEKAIAAMTQELEASKLIKLIFKSQKADEKTIAERLTMMAKSKLTQFKLGINACYLPNTNKIILPDKSLQTSVFHEMGHALNSNGNILLKGLQKCRPLATFLPPYILLISLLNKRKTTEETSVRDSKAQKSADFVKRNAGKLTALSIAPMIIEEGLASLRGQNIAKKLVKSGDLSKELFKKVKLTNLCGFSSYMLLLLTSAIATKCAINKKDKIQENYEQKQLIKYILENENIK